MKSESLYLKIMLLAVFFCFFIASSCKNNGGGDVKPPVVTPPVSTPPVETPPVETPPVVTPPVIDINSCKDKSFTESQIRALNEMNAARDEMVQTKIVGGQTAPEGRWPWAASIVRPQTNGSLFSYCGGSLIGDHWVLTAAHCPVRLSDRVIIGRHDLSTNEGRVFNVKQVTIHCNYNPQTNDSDLALVELEPFSGVALPDSVGLIDRQGTNAQAGDPSTIIGWGLLEEGGSPSDKLQQVTVPIVSNAQCKDSYPGSITDNMLCAGRPEGGQDSCQGDSVGPLMVQQASDGNWDQAGIVSWGQGCAQAELYGVYTRVSRFLPWIKDTMNGE